MTDSANRGRASKPRKCFYIAVESFDDHGYIPSLVTADEAGHAPLAGSGELAAPWHWGTDYNSAVTFADKQNLEVFGLSKREAMEVVLSSMRAGAPAPSRRPPVRFVYPAPETSVTVAGQPAARLHWEDLPGAATARLTGLRPTGDIAPARYAYYMTLRPDPNEAAERILHDAGSGDFQIAQDAETGQVVVLTDTYYR